MPIVNALPRLCLISLGACAPGFAGLPVEPAVQTVKVGAYEKATVKWTFQNQSPTGVPSPRILAGCKCLMPRFDRDIIPAYGSAVLSTDLQVSKAGNRAQRLRLVWENGLITDLGIIASVQRKPGLDLSARESSLEEWRRSRRLRLGFMADFFAPVPPLWRESLTVAIDGRSATYKLVHTDPTASGIVTGELIVEFPTELPGKPRDGHVLSVNVPGLKPGLCKILY